MITEQLTGEKIIRGFFSDIANFLFSECCGFVLWKHILYTYIFLTMLTEVKEVQWVDILVRPFNRSIKSK